ncbi:MAG: DNA-binding domain-containing protein [Rhodospirillales bacterium]|nr:DNA-binding domain-containing protein [Rhodospirillales bacterium]
MWHETQEQFAAALRNPDHPLPSTIGPEAEKGFNVYRNNVAVSLSEALGATFPVTQALVGDEFFKGMAQIFTRQFLPKTPVLLDYGEEFPDFVSTFPPAGSLPYLADVARLEWFWNRAYHSADVTPLTIQALADIPEKAIGEVHFKFHPSMYLLDSPWPVASIWHAHQGTNDMGNLPEGGEKVLILRPQMEVEIRSLPVPAFTFLRALVGGATLGQALEPFLNDEQFDPSEHLAALFELGVVTDLVP